jgi:hypothetical protein
VTTNPAARRTGPAGRDQTIDPPTTGREETAEVSIDPKTNAPNPLASAIENEIPTYRAVSPGAVVAVVLGVLSVLSFASWWFLAVAVLAMLVGWLSDRKIQRFPDHWTGRGLAQAGFGLGLIFGLTSVALATVQHTIRSTEAKRFSRQFEQVLAKNNVDEWIWYKQPPRYRAAKTVDQMLEEKKKSNVPPGMNDMAEAPYHTLKDKLASQGAEVHFRGLEFQEPQELNVVAGAMFEVHDPNAAKPEDRESFALAVLRGIPNDVTGKLEWMVEDIKYPYNPKSYVVPQKPVGEEEHGHPH